MTGPPQTPPPGLPSPLPGLPSPLPGAPSPLPWAPELPGSPLQPGAASSTLPPLPAGYAAAPPPTGRGAGWLNRRLIIILVVIAVLVIVGIVGAVATHNSRSTIVTSASTDGTFSAGDCVSLSSTRVTKSDCVGAHDAQIIQVIHGNATCPGGTEEFDVNDGTGNLCLDKGNSSKG